MPISKYTNFESTLLTLTIKNGLENIVFCVYFQIFVLGTYRSYLPRKFPLSYNLNRIFFFLAQIPRVPISILQILNQR